MLTINSSERFYALLHDITAAPTLLKTFTQSVPPVQFIFRSNGKKSCAAGIQL